VSSNYLHIVSFTVPYPANYGGVIDVFHKIRLLHSKGVKIILHCFLYDRKEAKELEAYCEKIIYYPRKTGFKSFISFKPYIVKSRKSEALLKNIAGDNFPVMFEGLHCCYYLSHHLLKHKKKIYRESNIEHHYYYHLYKAEKNILKKIFFLSEAAKLYFFQNTLKHADEILVVSKEDAYYLAEALQGKKIKYLPSFHPYDKPVYTSAVEDYILYHGNFNVSENTLAAEYLIREVFSKLPDKKIILAGLNPPESLIHLVKKHPHISITANPDTATMQKLINSAKLNVLITFQATGLKLKLLNALFTGKQCIVNKLMIKGTDLEKTCIVASTASELIAAINTNFTKDFSEEEFKERTLLLSSFDNEKNVTDLMQLLF
jgi:hypothetical protein